MVSLSNHGRWVFRQAQDGYGTSRFVSRPRASDVIDARAGTGSTRYHRCMAKPIAVLAYSGGLDTSVLLHWLQDNGWDVAAYTANLGQPDADLDAASEKARQLGAIDTYIEDLRGELVDEFFLPVLQMHARYEGRYLLGTAIARRMGPSSAGRVRGARPGTVLLPQACGPVPQAPAEAAQQAATRKPSNLA